MTPKGIIYFILIFITLISFSFSENINKINPLLQYQIRANTNKTAEVQHRVINGEAYYPVFIRAHSSLQKLQKNGYIINPLSPHLGTAELTRNQIDELSQHPEIIGIEGASKREPVLDISASTSMTLDYQGHPLYQGIHARPLHNRGINGSGVIVGVVDSGIDYMNDDFRWANGSTRILSIWDQSDLTTGTPPSGYSYGQEYSRTTIDYQIANPGIKIISQNAINIHGSHVTGISAGNGRSHGSSQPEGTYTGIAPESEIIFVKTDFNDTHLVDAVQYIFNIASTLNKPAVVNLSIGGQYGPHDGSSAMESGISSLCGPGRIVVVAAGNDGSRGYHAENQVAIGSEDTCRFPMSSSNRYLVLNVWYSAGDMFDCQLISPAGSFITTAFNSVSYGTLGGGSTEIYNSVSSTASGDREMYITVSLLTSYGNWNLILKRNSGSTGNGRYHAWVVNQATQFNSPNTTYRYLVTEPGHAKEAITVASYVVRLEWIAADGLTYSVVGNQPGQISAFSGIGPSRDESRKPDLAAPGQIIASTMSSFSPSSTVLANQTLDRKHWYMQGTSMACPMVTGAVALILQREPGLTPVQVKQKLITMGTKSDAATGSVPDSGYKWGYGKLNLKDTFPTSTEAIIWPDW